MKLYAKGSFWLHQDRVSLEPCLVGVQNAVYE